MYFYLLLFNFIYFYLLYSYNFYFIFKLRYYKAQQYKSLIEPDIPIAVHKICM